MEIHTPARCKYRKAEQKNLSFASDWLSFWSRYLLSCQVRNKFTHCEMCIIDKVRDSDRTHYVFLAVKMFISAVKNTFFWLRVSLKSSLEERRFQRFSVESRFQIGGCYLTQTENVFLFSHFCQWLDQESVDRTGLVCKHCSQVWSLRVSSVSFVGLNLSLFLSGNLQNTLHAQGKFSEAIKVFVSSLHTNTVHVWREQKQRNHIRE